MIREHEHLPLPVAEHPLERRKRPAPSKPRGDKKTHGEKLLREVADVETKLKHRQSSLMAGLDPAHVFTIALEKGKTLNEDVLRKVKLTLLAIEPDKAFVVSADKASLPELGTWPKIIMKFRCGRCIHRHDNQAI